jgi:hypothetical protein
LKFLNLIIDLYPMIIFWGINEYFFFKTIHIHKYFSPLSLPWQTNEYILEQFSIRRGKNERIISPQIRLDYDQYWSLIIYIVNWIFQWIKYSIFYLIFRMKQLVILMSCWNWTRVWHNKLLTNLFSNWSIPVVKLIVTMLWKVNDCSKKDNRMVLKGFDYFHVDYFIHFFWFKYRFYKLDNLSKDGFLDKKTDSIKIRFKLCPLSIFEQHKLLQWQIE